jgi:hypothetical protein
MPARATAPRRARRPLSPAVRTRQARTIAGSTGVILTGEQAARPLSVGTRHPFGRDGARTLPLSGDGPVHYRQSYRRFRARSSIWSVSPVCRPEDSERSRPMGCRPGRAATQRARLLPQLARTPPPPGQPPPPPDRTPAPPPRQQARTPAPPPRQQARHDRSSGFGHRLKVRDGRRRGEARASGIELRRGLRTRRSGMLDRLLTACGWGVVRVWTWREERRRQRSGPAEPSRRQTGRQAAWRPGRPPRRPRNRGSESTSRRPPRLRPCRRSITQRSQAHRESRGDACSISVSSPAPRQLAPTHRHQGRTGDRPH